MISVLTIFIIISMRLSNLVKTKFDDDSDYQGSDDGNDVSDEP